MIGQTPFRHEWSSKLDWLVAADAILLLKGQSQLTEPKEVPNGGGGLGWGLAWYRLGESERIDPTLNSQPIKKDNSIECLND